MNLVIVFAVLLFAIVIIETVLSATWSKYYFLYGVPIFVKEIEISKISETKQRVSEFINNMDSKKGFSKYKGKEIFENNFAFRKKMITVSHYRNNFENIHGIISIDTEKRILKIKGYTGYTFLSSLIYIIIFLIDKDDFSLGSLISALFIILIIFLIAYAFEHRKYKQLVKELLELVNNGMTVI
ncbi:MAG: hypothetical protein MJ159_00735 [Treponemataceae bacterium]|nr:hypothetical protein [Treponemataceae bacterium]